MKLCGIYPTLSATTKWAHQARLLREIVASRKYMSSFQTTKKCDPWQPYTSGNRVIYL